MPFVFPISDAATLLAAYHVCKKLKTEGGLDEDLMDESTYDRLCEAVQALDNLLFKDEGSVWLDEEIVSQ